MIVHPLFSLIRKIFRDVKVGMLGRLDQISVDFEGKCSKVTVIDSSSLNDLFSDVLAQSFDDKMELGFGIKRLHRFIGPGLGGLVLSGIVLSMGNDPKC